MTRVQITWQRTCEYVATVDTGELRELIAPIPGARATLDRITGGHGEPMDSRTLAYLISNTETGREWLGALADDNPEYLGGTGAPEITGLELAATEEDAQS